MEFTMLVKPEVILGQSKKITAQTGNLREQMKAMQDQVVALNTVWEAKSGQMFVEKYSKVRNNIEKHIQYLDGLCASINEAAEAYIASENANTKQIEQLTSSDLFK